MRATLQRGRRFTDPSRSPFPHPLRGGNIALELETSSEAVFRHRQPSGITAPRPGSPEYKTRKGNQGRGPLTPFQDPGSRLCHGTVLSQPRAGLKPGQSSERPHMAKTSDNRAGEVLPALTPSFRMLLVRLAMEHEDLNRLLLLMRDEDPAVRWLVFESCEEMDGARPRRDHHAAMVAAVRWGRAFRAGKARKIPQGFECAGLGPVEVWQ